MPPMKRMMLFLFSCLILFAVDAQSSDRTTSPCPSVSVAVVGDNYAESPFFFKAAVANLPPNENILYKWNIYNGEIIGGHGTSLIEVIGKRPITASVELTEYSSRCKNVVASVSLISFDSPPPVQQVSEFGSIPFKRQKKSLDEFVYRLRKNLGARGFIIAYGRWSFAREALKYLIETQGFETSRLVYVEKPRKGKVRVKLLLVPPGAALPN